MVLAIRSSKNRTLSIAINKNQHLIVFKKIMLNFLNIRGAGGVDFQNFVKFFSKIEPPSPRGRGE